MWRQTTKQEHNRKIFEEELDDFLPEKILDFHIHILNQGVLPEGKTMPFGGDEIAKYDFDDLQQDLDDVYPGRETFGVCFGAPFRGFDRARNNDYVSDRCDNKRFFALRLLDPNEDDAETLRNDLRQRFLGIKPYREYVTGKKPEEVEIEDMLPEWAMEAVDDRGGIVMLHIPKERRLADPGNQRRLIALCERYPKAKIVLAHVGRAFYLQNVLGNLDNLKDFPNFYVDVSMLNHWEVLEHAFTVLPPERILYGTDMPMALVGGKSVEINNQYTYITAKPWHLSISDDHGKIVFTSFLYEELRALKRAVERIGLPREFVEGLFYKNGMRLLEGMMGCRGM